ncbi:MAG: spermidine/putrescine ABC transporter substrate-binding protein, partial [Solirubrobacterales bacterium]|nr:spermidine/putrescine ABC transporter substrate-binding protein [Solirubrobacterales bacterium]
MKSPVTRPARLIAGLVVLLASLMLAACGSDLGGGGREGDVTEATAEGTASGELTISQWPFYIDKDTIPEFEDQIGVSVKYIEDVNDNNEIFSKLQPTLQKGDAQGRSIIVVTDWMAKKMYDLGYLQNLDKSAIPTVAQNLQPSLQSPSFDPNRDYSVPWQSGMTGLVVNKAEAPDVTSVNDIFDPKYKGKVTVLTELRDTVPLVMKAEGIDPADATKEDWLAAIDKLKAAVDSGQIRDFTGNDYTNTMARGDATVAIGWSGDAVQLQADNPDIQFVMPDEGCILWSDNMVVPVGAPNPTAAYAFMNYVYEPKNQAPIAAYNSYVTPVSGVQEIFQKQDPELAKSELIFPSEDYQKNCSTQP